MTYKILVVDDEAANLRLLERLFRRQFEVITALSGFEGLELLKQHNVALIISDQRMPGMTGIEFLKQAAALRQHTVRIILTGYTDINALVEAINSGVVYKYVTKPWVNEDLQQTVVRGLQYYETCKKQHELKLHNQRLSQSLKETQQGFVRLIADMLDQKDRHAYGHARRVSCYASAVGRRLGLEDEELEQLSLAAFLHEAGHLGVFPSMPEKAQALTKEEFFALKPGLERVLQTFAGVPQINEIGSAIRYQYERADGGGFPEGLSGKQIPLFSRIIVAACTYDRLTCAESHGQSLTHEAALESLRAESEKRFDGEIVKKFFELRHLGKIRRAVSEVTGGRRFFATHVPVGERYAAARESMRGSLAEILRKIVEPNDTLFADPSPQISEAIKKFGGAELQTSAGDNKASFSDEKIKEHTARAERLAEAAWTLAAQTEVMHPDDAYALGLFFDIGEFLLENLFPSEMAALEKFEEKDRPRMIVENFGVEPAQISCWILEACGLAPRLSKALLSADESRRINDPAGLLMMVARQVVKVSRANKSFAFNSIGGDVMEALKLNPAQINSICERFAVADGSRPPEEFDSGEILLNL